MARSDALQRVLDCAFAAFDQFATDPRSRRSVARMFASLEVQGPERAGGGTRLPLCDAYLESALAIDLAAPTLTALRDGFRALEPGLDWRVRTADDGSASENFPTGHANTMIVGPGGLEQRDDLWFGATLMAPHVRYPDHTHPPEETYLVLSEGEFKQGDADWFSPGLGGSFYNPPGIRHAMRSADKPLFAFWMLSAARSHH